MNAFRSFPCSILISLAAFVASVHANTLSGRVIGVFEPADAGRALIVNSPDGDASFRSGVAVGGSFQSGVVFDSQSFAGIGEDETVSLGSFSYYNGITQIGTSSGKAVLDLYLQLSDPLLDWVHLTTLNFGIDATINSTARLISDRFTVTYAQPASLLLGDEWFKFSLSGLPASTTVAENSHVDVGSLSLSFGPVVAVADSGASWLLSVFGVLALGIFGQPRIFSGRRFFCGIKNAEA